MIQFLNLSYKNNCFITYLILKQVGKKVGDKWLKQMK